MNLQPVRKLHGFEPHTPALPTPMNCRPRLLTAFPWHALVIGLTLWLGACAEVPPPGPETSVAAMGQRVFPAEPAQAQYVFERALYGRNDLMPNPNTGFMTFLTGKSRGQETLAEGLARPQAIAVHQGRVFVANAMDAAISVFDLNQRRFYKVGDQTTGALRAPVGLSVNRAGELFVADAAAQAVLVYDTTGRYVRRIGGPRWFTHLTNVTVEAKTKRVYALDQDDARQQVRVFDGLDGTHLFDFGAPGNGPGQLDQPVGLALGLQGQVLVVDGGNLRVQVFDADGHFIRSIGRPGKQPGEFARPKEIAVDAQSQVYVADSALGTVQVFTSQGDYLYAIGTRSQSDAPGHYLISGGLAVDTDGRLVVADQWFGKLEVFRPVRSHANSN